MMNWNGDGYGWMGGGWTTGFFCALLVAVAIILSVFIARRGKPEIKSESARQILDRRFAEGSIEAEAYAQARRLLEGHSE